MIFNCKFYITNIILFTRPNYVGLVCGWQPHGAVWHSSNRQGESLQYLCSGNSTKCTAIVLLMALILTVWCKHDLWYNRVWIYRCSRIWIRTNSSVRLPLRNGHSGSTSAHIYILSQPVNKASAGNSYFFCPERQLVSLVQS